MFRALSSLSGVFADYTVGTVIVFMQLARRSRDMAQAESRSTR
jgi:hypothetical protein